jgi:Terpene cyclase DEP1
MATTPPIRLRHVYLALCVVGAVLPYSQFIPWLLQHRLDLPLFYHQLFGNRIGGFFGFDVIVSSLVLWVFVFAEGRRLGVRLLWLPVVASLVVGVSLGLPLFLYMRQLHLDDTAT